MAVTIDGTSGVTFPAGGLGNTAGAVVGTSDAQTLTNKTIQGGALTLATAQNSTSGTAIDFTGIPSWVKRITVMFNGVSTSGVSWQIQVGTGGTYTTSGYVGAVTNQAGTATANSTGFLVNVTVAATDTMWGQATILKTGGNSTQVQCTGILANSAVANLRYFGGAVTPENVIDCVRITTVNDAGAFDAGSINIMYEG